VLRREGNRPVYGIPVFGAGSPRRRIPDHLGGDDPASQRERDAFLSRKHSILGLGDSFTIGQGVRYEDTYLRRLEKRLAQDGRTAWIKNTATWGCDLEEIWQTYLSEWRREHHRLVIYGFVLNDFGLPNYDHIAGFDYIDFNNAKQQANPWRKRLATINFVAHMVEKIRVSRVTKRAYFKAFQGENAKRKFSLLAALSRWAHDNDSRLVIVLFPLLYEFDDYPFQEIHDKIAAFCRQESILLLDLLPAFSEYEDRELWVHPTDHHPNEVAHRIAAEEIYKFLKQEHLLELLDVDADTLHSDGRE